MFSNYTFISGVSFRSFVVVVVVVVVVATMCIPVVDSHMHGIVPELDQNIAGMI